MSRRSPNSISSWRRQTHRGSKPAATGQAGTAAAAPPHLVNTHCSPRMSDMPFTAERMRAFRNTPFSCRGCHPLTGLALAHDARIIGTNFFAITADFKICYGMTPEYSELRKICRFWCRTYGYHRICRSSRSRRGRARRSRRDRDALVLLKLTLMPCSRSRGASRLSSLPSSLGVWVSAPMSPRSCRPCG